jgi:microsomal dipeptidase-like Zn-dependent dipeptidase
MRRVPLLGGFGLLLVACNPFEVPGLAPLVVTPSPTLAVEPTMCGQDKSFLLPEGAPDLLKGTKLVGAADYHNHQFSNLGFGTHVLQGASFDPEGIDRALSVCGSEDACLDSREDKVCKVGCLFSPDPDSCRNSCSDVQCESSPPHGHLGLQDPIGAFLGQGKGHRVRGYPDFVGWPHYNSYTHQQEYYRWLERAVQGGLRLLVMHALSNEVLCKFLGSGKPCDDMANADLQLTEARRLQCYVDYQNDCQYNNNGWYQVADSPADARRIIARGGLAVVLGLEIDSLFNCHDHQCSPQSVHDALVDYRNKGVRHVFPIHLFDNAFGGTAVSRDFFNFGSAVVNHDLLHVRDCTSAGYEFHFGEASVEANALMASMAKFFGIDYPHYPSGAKGQCNERPLSDLGKTLIAELMDNGMLIDVDHMSTRARADTLALATSRKYPGLVSGHSGFVEQLHGEIKHEGQLTKAEVETVLALGGVIAPILHQGDHQELDDFPTPTGAAAIPNDCAHSAKSFVQAYRYAVAELKSKSQRPGIGFGSDINGFAGMPAPRFGPYACGGDSDRAPQQKQVAYPFMPLFAKLQNAAFQLDREQSGYRIFDINYDGFAQMGLLPDFIEELEQVGLSQEELKPLFYGAEAYLQTWEAADALAKTVPAPNPKKYATQCEELLASP